MTQASSFDDLNYIRDLAEAGQSAPLLGGRFLTWWGALATLAYGMHYAIMSGIADLPSISLAWLWGGFSVIGIAGYFLLIRTIRGKPGASSIGNRVEATVWMAGAFALFAFFGGLILKSIFDQTPAIGFEHSLPVVFAVYGVGLLTSGFISQTRALTTAGFLALGFVALSVWFGATVESWAIAALGAFVTVFVPGLVLLRSEPSPVV